MICARLLTSECLRSNSMHQILKLEIIYRPNVLTMTKTLYLRIYKRYSFFLVVICSITFFHCCKYIVGCSRGYIECIEHIPEHARIHFKLYKYMIQIHCGTCSDSHFKYIHPC